jgi:hypothetical protein
MVMRRKRRLLVGLGSTVALVLGLGLSSAAAAVPTLTGEMLSGSSSQGNSHVCLTPNFSLSGTASGPYPGSFMESGTWAPLDSSFTTTFTITSGTTTITGAKTFSRGTPGLSGFFDCGADPTTMDVSGIPYTATIQTPNGSFHDEGVSTVFITITASGVATLTESFISSLTEPVPTAPTSKDQCKNGGWKAFPQFKNQGQCVRFVSKSKA